VEEGRRRGGEIGAGGGEEKYVQEEGRMRGERGEETAEQEEGR